MDEPPNIRLAPEPEPEPEPVEASNVRSLPERPGQAAIRIENQIAGIERLIRARLPRPEPEPAQVEPAGFGFEVEPLDPAELAKQYAELKAREYARNKEKAEQLIWAANHEWWEPEKKPANRNALFAFGIVGLMGFAFWRSKATAKRLKNELDLLEVALGEFEYTAQEVLGHVVENAASTVAPNILTRVAQLLPRMVASEVERAGVSPIHRTEVVERAKRGRPGRDGKTGKSGKAAKLTVAQVEAITRKAIKTASSTALAELRRNPSKYRGTDGVLTMDSYEADRAKGILD